MPEIKLCKRDRDVYLFVNPELVSLEELTGNVEPKEKPEEDPDENANEFVLEGIDVDPSFTHLACSSEWEVAPIQIILDIDVFTKVFLTEETIEGITKRYPRHSTPGKHSTVYFHLESIAIESLKNVLTIENTTQVSEETFKQEREAFEQETASAFTPSYTFPVSFLSEAVQKALKLKKRKNEIDNGDKRKSRLRPSHEIYDRIKHDPTVEKDQFIIGYLDRFTGIKETAFTTFVTLDNERYYNTSVPFHRVRYFKYKGKIVWDRETRMNLIDNNEYLNV